MQTVKSMLRRLAMVGCLSGLTGCGTPTLKYNNPLAIAQLPPRATNPAPLPTSLAVRTPTVQGERIAASVKGNKPGLFIAIKDAELAGNFRTALYNDLSQSRLYQHTTLAESPDAEGHLLETTIFLPTVDCSRWTVWGDYTTTVDVDYAIRSSAGAILKSGRISEGGRFDQGHGGFSFQEKMRFYVEPVLQALAKASAHLPEVLLNDMPKEALGSPDVARSGKALPPRVWPPENIAVADLTAYTLSPGETMTLTEKLHSTLARTQYFNLLSRSDMKAVLETQQFRRTGACDDSACLVEMGKLLAVQKIVGGSVGKVGSTYSLSLRLVDVETGKTELTTDRQLKAEPDQLLDLVQDAALELSLRYAQAMQQ